MCKFCNLEVLDVTNFDSFFQGACTHGYKSMVCKHCSTPYLTELAFLDSGGSSRRVLSSVRKSEDKDMTLIPY